MSEYKRLVSYIYSYPGGVRDRNVGFAKAEVRGGQFKLNVALKGVYTDVPMTFGIYLMISLEQVEKKFYLLKLGNTIVNAGVGKFQDLLNPEDINHSGYQFADVKGIAVVNKEDSFYQMFSLWEDIEFKQDMVVYELENRKEQIPEKTANSEKEVIMPDKINEKDSLEEKIEEEKIEEEKITENTVIEDKESSGTAVSVINSANSENMPEKPIEKTAEQAEVLKSAEKVKEIVRLEKKESKKEDIEKENTEKEIRLQAMSVKAYANNKQEADKNKIPRDGFEKFYRNADIIDAFDEDYYYDCIEVTPEELRKMPIEDAAVVNNSFLIHGYYNFKHILFGRVRENDNGTRYFVGVPGMYCNRERFMASMYGFNNFKKSHRSDYSNPYFGYWYQEI